MSKQKNAPQAPKEPTKAQIKEAKRLRTVVSQSIYPLLLKDVKSVKEAKDICKTLIVGMDAIFNQKVKEYQSELSEKPLSALDLIKFMSDKKQYKTERALIELLGSEKIVISKMLIEGMGKEIDRLLEKEQAERALETLKTEWLD